MSIYNFEKDYQRTIQRIQNSVEIIEENKLHMKNYVEHLISENISLTKVNRYLQDLTKLDRMLNKPFQQAIEQDMRRIISELNQSKYSEHTKRGFKVAIRKFYRFLRGITQPKTYPPEVAWISLHMPANRKKLPEELLTDAEIKSIINNCECLRDRALVACLAESGARVGEIGNMLVKHVSFEEYGARITIQGKTGGRKILVVWSAPYIQQWINQHPLNTNPNSPLWYSSQRRGILGYQRISAIIKLAARRAKISKRVYPHLLRHTRATRMASIMTESGMKQYFGWTQSSAMAGVYVHMSGKDTDDAVLQANGIRIEKEKSKNLMEPKTCFRCAKVNESTNIFCKFCGLVLDEKYANEILVEDTRRKEADKIMNTLLQDAEILEIIKKKLKNPGTVQ